MNASSSLGAVGFNLNAGRFGFFIERDVTHSGDMDSCGHGSAHSNNSLIHPTRLATPRRTTADLPGEINRRMQSSSCTPLGAAA